MHICTTVFCVSQAFLDNFLKALLCVWVMLISYYASPYTWQRYIAKCLSHALFLLKCPAKERKHCKFVAGDVVFCLLDLVITSFIIILISSMIFWSYMVFPSLWLTWAKAFLKLFSRASLVFWVTLVMFGYVFYLRSRWFTQMSTSRCIFLAGFSFRTSFERMLKPGALRAQF